MTSPANTAPATAPQDREAAYFRAVAELVEAKRPMIELLTLKAPEDAHGIPPEITVGRHSGSGMVIDLAKHFEPWRTAPERRKGVAKANTIASLIELTNRHKDDDSVLFADLDASAPWVAAVFDYHTKEHDPRYGQHRALYAFPLSDEWKAWIAKDNSAMAQGEWASFIEEHIADLASPFDAEVSEFEDVFKTRIATPAELITLSRGLQISVESKVRDFRTLQSGEVEISYEEVHKDGGGQKLVVPGLFVLNIPLFIDSERQPVRTRILARLRYRKKDGGVVWFYQLYRAKQELRAAMRLEAEKVAAETGLPLFEGTPEAG